MTPAHLRHLAHFVMAAEAGSVTAAANRLGIAASAVSTSIKTVEARFGRPLMERTATGVSPVGEGIAVYEAARPIVSSLEALADLADPDRLHGVVRVSVPVEAIPWLGPALEDLAATEPGLDVRLFGEDRVLDPMKFARDIHIRMSPGAAPKALTVLGQGKTKPVYVARAGLVAPEAASDPDALSTLTLIRSTDAKDAVFQRPGGRSITFAKGIFVSSIQARIDLARAGLGVVGCLRHTVAQELAEGSLVEVLPDDAKPDVHIYVGTPHTRVPRHVRHVATCLADALSA